jgi:hypothetical protein
MYFAIWVLLTLAFLSWFYTTIILPDVRDSITYKLFALRDELRRHKMNHPNVISDQAFTILQTSINNAIALTPWISVITVLQARSAFLHNRSLLEEAGKRSHILQHESGPTIARIWGETQDEFAKAMRYNMIIVIPLMLIGQVIYFLVRKMTLKSRVQYWAANIPVVPQSELGEISPALPALIAA